MPKAAVQQRKVAGYARVSTDSEEQLTNYEAQVDYYTRYIRSRSDWQFVDVYTDEGISATNTKRREGFNRMVRDALDGKIDLIVTKSVSRFARNTVDSLTTVRKLKDAGVEVYFEKENIWTLDSKGELLITIMPPWPRKKADPSPRMLPGASGNGSLTVRSASPMDTSWVIGKVLTGCRKLFPRRRRSSEAFTGCSSPVQLPMPLPGS